MQVLSLDHVQLSMPRGYEQMADRFYVDMLGFDVEEKPPVLAARGGRWYRSGNVRFHLGIEESFAPARNAHPAFIITDLGALVASLHERDVDVTWDEHIAGVRRCYVADPFGNRIELVAAR